MKIIKFAAHQTGSEKPDFTSIQICGLLCPVKFMFPFSNKYFFHTAILYFITFDFNR